MDGGRITSVTQPVSKSLPPIWLSCFTVRLVKQFDWFAGIVINRVSTGFRDNSLSNAREGALWTSTASTTKFFTPVLIKPFKNSAMAAAAILFGKPLPDELQGLHSQFGNTVCRHCVALGDAGKRHHSSMCLVHISHSEFATRNILKHE